MVISAPIIRPKLNVLLGLFSGVLFTVIVGYLDSAAYLIEQLSIGIVEIPFIVLWAVFGRKYGWKNCLLYVLLSAVISFALTIQEKSITPVVFLKVSLMGIILGEVSWFEGSFTRRLLAVSFPGIVLSFVCGLPLILHGVTPEVMERIRQDALEIYQSIMPVDEAMNAAENAMQMFRGIFKAGFAVFVISSLVFAWLSFLVSQWIMVKFKEEQEYVAPLHYFKLPFHAIWVFLGGFGLLLIEYELVFPLALNVFVIMAFLYLIQGIAIVMYYMNRFSMGRVPRVLFWLLFIIMFVFSGIFLIFTGVIDSWFNFRSIASDHKPNGK